MTELRKLGPQTRSASFAPPTANAEKRTVDLTWSTGAKVRRTDWWSGEQFDEVLAMGAENVRMGRLNNGAPFLRDHHASTGNVMGVVESARLVNGEGVATIRFAPAGVDPDADKLFEKIRAGIVQNVSVGYRVHKTEMVEKLDPSGKRGVPELRVLDWEPYEISAVAAGADDGAGFRNAQMQPNEVHFTRSNMDPKVTPPEPTPTVDAAKIAADAVQAERARIRGIERAAKSAKLPADEVRKLIEENVSLDRAREICIERMAEEGDKLQEKPAISVGDSDEDKFARMFTAVLLTRAAATEEKLQAAKAKHPEQFKDVSLDAGDLRGASLMILARECVERKGVSTRRMTNDQIVSRAFTMKRDGGYTGTDDFTVLLETAMGKILLADYATIPNTWSLFCGTDTVPDFRKSPRYRLGEFGTLDSVGENGEFKNKGIPDGSKVEIDVATKGNIISVSRQLIVNDDMGAIQSMLSKFSRMAARSIETDVYALLTANGGLGVTMPDTNPLFHASRANIGTGAALSVAGIDADRTVMKLQKGMSGQDFLDLSPTILLVPVGLGSTAKQINNMQFDGSSNKFQVPNTVQGLFRTIIDSPRLTGTRRYLFAAPSEAAVIKVVFREGAPQGPTLETKDGWRIDGTEIKLKIDYKAQAFDPKGAVTNAGV